MTVALRPSLNGNAAEDFVLTQVTKKNIYADVSEELKKKKHQLISDLMEGKAPAFLEDHAKLIDDYFRASYEKSVVGPKIGIARNPYAVVALGGYGRSEQCVASDVDLLFLFEKRVPKEAEELVREIVYPLWDMGLDVGHATRSIKECIQLARKDYEVLTSFLDARFICGMSPLFLQLMEQIRTKFINLKPDHIITWLIETNRERHRRFGDSSYLLEPNFKEGQGGLRDYHTMLWIAKIRSGIKQRRDLEYYGYLSHDEYTNLSRSLSFVWDIRNRFHLMIGRKSDQLHLEHQEKLAREMDIKAVNGHLPVEVLLGDLHSHMEYLKQQHAIFLYDLEQQKRRKRKNKALKTTHVKGLKFDRGMLNFTSPEKIVKTPGLLIDIFLESAVQKTPLHTEAKRLVSEFGYLIDKPFSSSRDIVRAFEKILVKPVDTFNVLNEMLNTGFLVRFIPEFKQVINRIQFDQYHLYPAGRHLLFTVRTLKGFSKPDLKGQYQLYHDIYKEVKKKKLLLWAALLHDIGKGSPTSGHARRGAEMASEILKRKGYSLGDIKTICFLVEHHLLLILAATRRDINDEETAITLARKIKRVDLLKMLYLLTVADSMATGPKAWNDWTSSLLRNLFIKVLNVLENGELATRKAVRAVEEKKQHVHRTMGEEMASSGIEDLFAVMSPRYQLYTSAEDMPLHIGLFNRLGNDNFVWQVDKALDSDTRSVTICAKDRPGLISKIAGVFTMNSINILDVQIFTWRNNIALDIFKVMPPPDQLFEGERWERAEKQLKDALDDRLDISSEIALRNTGESFVRPHTSERPTEIVIDNESSSFFTIIEVFTYDFPGLLFRVSDALFRSGLDIWVAKIATKVDQVVDVFYVRDFDGFKIDTPAQVEKVKAAIEAILPGELLLRY